MRFDIVGVLGDLVLRGGDSFADASDFEVEVGETVLEELGVWVGVERKLVLLYGLGGVVRATCVDGHILVEVREPVVVIGGSTIRRGGCGICGCGSLREHRVGCK